MCVCVCVHVLLCSVHCHCVSKVEGFPHESQNSQAVKMECSPDKILGEKNVNQKWRSRNGCDGRLMAKILITTIQCCLGGHL